MQFFIVVQMSSMRDYFPPFPAPFLLFSLFCPCFLNFLIVLHKKCGFYLQRPEWFSIANSTTDETSFLKSNFGTSLK